MQKAITYPMGSRRQRRRGFTLTEIAIVLGIVGLILGAIWVAAAAVYNNLRVGRANTEILQIAQGVRTLYSTSATTGVAASASLLPSLISAKVIPSDLVNGAAAAINPWAGGITEVYNTSSATADSFTVQMTNVPMAACISLLMGVGGVSRDASLNGVGATTAAAPITAVTAGTSMPSAGPLTLPVTVALATTACSAANNVISFSFGLK